jgi:outer membrane protein TolC
MLRRQKYPNAVVLLAVVAASLVLAQERTPARAVQAMTLRECIAAALANNLDLSIAAYDPILSEESVSATKEQYLPQFNLSYFKGDQTTPGSWGVEGAAVRTKTDNYSLTLSEKIVTGTTASLLFSNGMIDTSRAFSLVNPAYNSNFTLMLTQSLLKGFGPKVNRIGTLQAENQRYISVSTLKATLLQTVYDIEDAYWSLYSAVENMKVQENSLEECRALLKKNQEAVRIGAKSALDILNSETEVAQYEDALVSARLIVEQSEARLKKLMNFPADSPLSGGRTIVLADKPTIENKDVGYDEALRVAFEQRPEMIQSEKEIENYDYSISAARNDMLPRLDLTFQAWSPGQSGVMYVYDNGSALTGNLIGKITGSRVEALKQALKMTYKNWSLRLDFNLPLSNIFSRSSLAIAKMERDQALLSLERQKQSIAYEIADAIKGLQNAGRRVESSRMSRELQEKRLAAETQRYQLGLAGSEWLLSYQQQLTNARTSEIRALIDYKMAVAKLEKAMGTTLRTMGLKFRNYEF